jgi:hypothetical protein
MLCHGNTKYFAYFAKYVVLYGVVDLNKSLINY